VALRYYSQEKSHYLLTTSTVRCFSAYNGGLAASSGARKERPDQVQQHSHYCNSARSKGTPVSHRKNITDHIIWNISRDCYYICVEVKVTPKVMTVKERSTTPILDLGHSTPKKELRYPFTRGWVGLEASVVGYDESLPPTGIRYPDRPARSQSLYRMSSLGL
jgi:hypothetical protein